MCTYVMQYEVVVVLINSMSSNNVTYQPCTPPLLPNVDIWLKQMFTFQNSLSLHLINLTCIFNIKLLWDIQKWHLHCLEEEHAEHLQ